MYAIALIRYRRPLEEVMPHVDAQRAYLQGLHDNGWLLVSGPFEPRVGGALLLRIPDGDLGATLDRIRDQDPFVREGVAQYELLPWQPVIGAEGLDQLGVG
ncbi:MAG: YciI family protein [Gemmatimonadales bacterium]